MGAVGLCAHPGPTSGTMPPRNRKVYTGASDATQRLFEACEDGECAKARRAIEEGGDIHWRDEESGYTPLMVAANPDPTRDLLGAVEIIHLLVDRGADVDAFRVVPQKKAGRRQSALYRATVFGCSKEDPILVALLGRGADWTSAAVPRQLSTGLLEHAVEVENARAKEQGGPPLLLRRKSSL